MSTVVEHGIPGLVPPVTTPRDRLLAALQRKPVEVEVEGIGTVRVQPLSFEELRNVRVASERDGVVDEEEALMLTLAARLVDLHEDEVRLLWGADVELFGRLVEAVVGGDDAPVAADFRSES